MLLLSTAYLPPVEYFYGIFCNKNSIIEAFETYQKQTWRNRCLIFSGNGPLFLSIPVEKPHGNHTMTKDILLSDHSTWRTSHWRSITSAYRNAPYFLYYHDLIFTILMDGSIKLLLDLNHLLLKALLKETGIDAEIGLTDHFIKPGVNANDLRFSIIPKSSGRGLLNNLQFPAYYQVFEDRFGYQSNGSIIDLLFNLGPYVKDYFEEMKTLNSENPNQ